LVAVDLGVLARRCIYEGSVEHKDRRSWLGVPKPRRSDNPEETATICPLASDRERELATSWVQMAVREARFDHADWRGGFPRRLWHRDDTGQYWYGYLTNQGAGDQPVARYKGWPIDAEEWRAHFG
jgi:hypothetical protein